MGKGLNSAFRQGVFPIKNPLKYKGKNAPFFRSNYEYAFMKMCDDMSCILEWSSENNIIPYLCPTDNKRHAYIVDNWIKMRTPDGRTVKYLVEVKPLKFTMPPVESKGRKRSSVIFERMTYIKNQAKWAAATAYAEQYGMKFKVITEVELGIPLRGKAK